MRDRAFERIIVIPVEENARFTDIISNIPRPDVVRHRWRMTDEYFYYIVKVKKEELLAIKLSVAPKSITRMRKARTNEDR